MAHSVRVAGHDLPLIDWPEAKRLGWSEEKYHAQYDYTKRLVELQRKRSTEEKAWRARQVNEYDRDTCESCGADDGWPHTAMFGGSGGEQVELSLCKKCQNEKGIWNAMLLRDAKKMSPAVREQVEIARANRFGYAYKPGGKKRHGKRTYKARIAEAGDKWHLEVGNQRIGWKLKGTYADIRDAKEAAAEFYGTPNPRVVYEKASKIGGKKRHAPKMTHALALAYADRGKAKALIERVQSYTGKPPRGSRFRVLKVEHGYRPVYEWTSGVESHYPYRNAVLDLVTDLRRELRK